MLAARPSALAVSGKKTTTVTLLLRMERNSKFVRGKKRACEDIEDYVLSHYGMKKLSACEYELTLSYEVVIPYIEPEKIQPLMHNVGS